MEQWNEKWFSKNNPSAYNAKKKKTRDKIPDYYEHIRQSKQEKVLHEAIFQIGNMEDCGCGSQGGELSLIHI